jgi:acetone carboxylase gamma subunit
MLTDRETELRDAYLKGYEDRINYSDKLVVDRYELAERYAVNQAKNNEVLDLVSKCDCPHLVACEICGEEKGLDGDFWKNKKKHDC